MCCMCRRFVTPGFCLANLDCTAHVFTTSTLPFAILHHWSDRRVFVLCCLCIENDVSFVLYIFWRLSKVTALCKPHRSILVYQSFNNIIHLWYAMNSMVESGSCQQWSAPLFLFQVIVWLLSPSHSLFPTMDISSGGLFPVWSILLRTSLVNWCGAQICDLYRCVAFYCSDHLRLG